MTKQPSPVLARSPRSPGSRIRRLSPVLSCHRLPGFTKIALYRGSTWGWAENSFYYQQFDSKRILFFIPTLFWNFDSRTGNCLFEMTGGLSFVGFWY